MPSKCGGASFSGGRGNVWGTLAGAFFIQIVRNGCSLLGVSADLQQIVIGAVIVIAVFIGVIRTGMEAKARRPAAAKETAFPLPNGTMQENTPGSIAFRRIFFCR